VTLIRDESKKLGLSTHQIDGVFDLIKIALKKGFVDTDYSSIYNAIDPQ
jgi:hypothetical protein